MRKVKVSRVISGFFMPPSPLHGLQLELQQFYVPPCSFKRLFFFFFLLLLLSSSSSFLFFLLSFFFFFFFFCCHVPLHLLPSSFRLFCICSPRHTHGCHAAGAAGECGAAAARLWSCSRGRHETPPATASVPLMSHRCLQNLSWCGLHWPWSYLAYLTSAAPWRSELHQQLFVPPYRSMSFLFFVTVTNN